MIEEIKCQCGDVIKERGYPSSTSAYYLTELNEDRYADSIAIPIEECVELAKSGGLDSWFSSNKGNGYPEDLSQDTFAYDIIGNSQNENMNRVYECEKCGSLHFVKNGKVLSYYSKDGYNQLFSNA